jgi:Fe-S cluster assembly ATPase SufC
MYTNKATKNVSRLLGTKSSVVQVQKADFLSLLKARYIKQKFNRLIRNWPDKEIYSEKILDKFVSSINFKRVANQTKLKSALGVANQNKIDYLVSLDPIDGYLQSKSDKNIKNGSGDLRYRLFFDFEVSIKNDSGHDVSGGQRAEYSLLHKLSNFQSFDFVLIDEMESSFDNPFLNKEIVDIIQRIGQTAIVFISTHNNNIGVSLKPDYYIYHEASCDAGETKFMHFCGRSTEETLTDPCGGERKLSEVLMETMEANKEAYKERESKYEASKN